MKYFTSIKWWFVDMLPEFIFWFVIAMAMALLGIFIFVSIEYALIVL
jgi:hypothetical protein